EAGIHQDGVLKERITYEIMDPEEVGIPSNKLILGKHSGRHAFKDRLEDYGYFLEGEAFEKAFKKFKDLADKKKYVFDEDIEAIISEEFVRSSDFYKLISANYSGGSDMQPVATIKLLIDGKEVTISESGDGPVDAAYQAVSKATGLNPTLESYVVTAITEGIDAQGEVTVRVEDEGAITQGQGSNTDIVVASVKAYVNALNKLRWRKEHPKRVTTQGM
ncbi:MAG TPA: alpha-isopropylmalate synthase regulatory domain-containing protein, partial [Thermodesulfobacteriota bacterium]|nr:alpha-isopropylmalate synthase regulatory domain-containing protein [Thermodesulfobacteriota bacterium]